MRSPVPNPLVSVIITTRNRKEMLKRAVESVLKQTYSDLELIIVDDHSTDGTSRGSIGHDDARIKYLRNEACRGANFSRNTGIRASRGELVCVLDDDDAWLPTKLEKQVKKFQSGPDSVGLIYTGYFTVTSDGHTILEANPTHRGSVYRILIARCIFGALTVMVRKEILIKAGLYDENLSSCQDWDLWIRVTKLCDVDFVDEPLAKYYIHGDQKSTQLTKVLDGRLYLYNKYRTDIESNPRVEGQHLLRIGILQLQKNNRRIGMGYLFRSITTNPFQMWAYLHLAMNAFAPTLHLKYLWKMVTVGGTYVFT